MHKKLLSVLLALVMILSVLPMAACAEEGEHTHDENCGCVTTLAICTHKYVTFSSQTYSYSNITDTTHDKNYVNKYICDDCGSILTTVVSTETEYHNFVQGPQVDSGSFEGDFYVVHQWICACGRSKYRTYWSYGSYSEYWFNP